MSLTVCIAANTLTYVNGGGHQWVYLNWALGFAALGCRVVWLEPVDPAAPAANSARQLGELRKRLAPYGLDRSVALWPSAAGRIAPEVAEGCMDLGAAAEADLLLNQYYGMPSAVVSRFRRSALLDIDPGLLQVWMSTASLHVAAHDVYFTTGETVSGAGARIPDVGVEWHYTPPCVAIDAWPRCAEEPDAPFTTVSHWYAGEWMEDAGGIYPNAKRNGFLPYLELPRHTSQRLELALCLNDTALEQNDRRLLQGRGWRVRHSHEVTATPWDYQRYIQNSRGEWSCAKPSCVRLQNAWVSDRTLCYLASGRPAVVQHTGPSRILPDAAGMFRFRNLKQAAAALEAVASDYNRHSWLARELAAEYFDARRVAARVLERALA
jgi:hypothetical protein